MGVVVMLKLDNPTKYGKCSAKSFHKVGKSETNCIHFHTQAEFVKVASVLAD